jgi:hypothetical protein
LVTAKLIGESDGYTVSRDFEHEGDAIRWLQRAGLVDFEDQTARGEIWMEGKLFWNRANLQTVEPRERGKKALHSSVRRSPKSAVTTGATIINTSAESSRPKRSVPRPMALALAGKPDRLGPVSSQSFSPLKLLGAQTGG